MKIKKTFLIFTLIGLLLLTGCQNNPVSFKDVIESLRTILISNYNGTVKIARKDEGEFDIYEGLLLNNGDKLHVYPSSDLLMDVDNDKHIYAEENTKFHVLAEGDEEISKTTIYLDSGALLCEINEKLLDDEYFIVQTPSSGMTVRGTVFRVSIIKNTDGLQYELIEAFDGQVYIQIDESKDDVTISKGECALIKEIPIGEEKVEDAQFVLSDELDMKSWKTSDKEIVLIKDNGSGSKILTIPYEKLPKGTIERLIDIIDDGTDLSADKEQFENIEETGHNFVERIVKEATCSTKGIKEIRCTLCDDVKEEEIPLEEHKIVTINRLNATCLTSGHSEYSYCEVCGKYIKTKQMLEALGHDPTEYREDGLYCARCGELIYKYEVLDNDPAPVSTQQPFSLKNIGTGSGNIVIDCPGSSTSPYYAGITAYLVYSKDQTTWNDVVLGSSIAISPNENVYIKAKTTNDVLCANGKSLVINGTGSTFEANGSIMWLLDGSGNKKQLNSTNSHCFETLFSNFTTLVSAPELPATTLADSCYRRMFKHCDSLINAPELPATNMADSCYQSMFNNCGLLVNAPELPATSLANSCYYSMFFNCDSLISAPELPATNMADSCYQSMFQSCDSLINAPKLPATNLAFCCYCRMFQGCSSLINAPKLPATTLVNNCYYYMFYDCSSLTKAPDLPATSLADYCYHRMFYNCTNLSYIKVEFTDWNNTGPNGPVTYQWLDNVAAVGRFICPGELDTSTAGQNYFPTGWSFGLNYTLEMGIENFSFRLPPPPPPIPGMEDIERDEYNTNTSSKFTSFKVDSLEYFGTSYYRGNYDTVGRFGTNISGAPAPYNGYLTEGLHTYSVTFDGFTYTGHFVLHKQYYTDVSYSNPTNVITSYYNWEIIDSY